MSLYAITKKDCTRCGTCVHLCVANIVEADDEKYPFVAEEKESRCIRCGQCVAFCPQRCNALSFQTDAHDVDAALFPTPEQAETLLRSRRSIRRFRKEGLPRETLDRIFETVRYAPTASNRQAVRWIVLDTREKTEGLERRIIEAFRREADGGSPDSEHVLMLRFILHQWDLGIPIIFRGAPQLAVAVVPADRGMREDGAIALTYLELAAHALGAGCCWGGFFTHAFRASAELRESLGIREDEYVAGAQMMGWPVLGLSKRLPPRKNPDITWL